MDGENKFQQLARLSCLVLSGVWGDGLWGLLYDYRDPPDSLGFKGISRDRGEELALQRVGMLSLQSKYPHSRLISLKTCSRRDYYNLFFLREWGYR